MRQVLQDIKSGEIAIHDVPEPMPQHGYALVQTKHSLISSGTERASADLGRASLLNKARARPDLVRRTLDVARAEGIEGAVRKVKTRLDQYAPFGYSCAGVVLDTGGDHRLTPGTAVACVGAGYACHAEIVSVPTSLVVSLPTPVSTLQGAFCAPTAIALHSIRLANVGPGSVVGVVGLGLIGQLAGRILVASGCTALGTDVRDDRIALFGRAAKATELEPIVGEVTRGRGLDAVLVCAATSSASPIETAIRFARDRATIVVVGDVGLELDRRPLYEKELSLVVARSYGPGRYDRSFEETGIDYPVGYVRWTETRNVEAVVDLLADGRLRVDDLVSHRLPISEGARAYALLDEDPSALAIALEYPHADRRRPSRRSVSAPRTGALRVAMIGAGNFARGTLLPELCGLDDVEVVAVCARTGASAKAAADRFDIPSMHTDWRSLLATDDVDVAVVATPHAEHAEIAAAALRAGKSVYVEKPLALDREQLSEVAAAARGSDGVLLVGHNRRFAPLAARARTEVAAPCAIAIRVAVAVAPDAHWLSDARQGGQVLGEISHFVDLSAFLGRGAPERVYARFVPSADGWSSMIAAVDLEGGSAATIVYSVGEARGIPKERVEVLGTRAAIVIDDFKAAVVHGSSTRRIRGKRDKGHRAALAAFVAAARGSKPLPVGLEEQLLVAEASLALLESAQTGAAVVLTAPE
ncbi:MAG TPA: bi-domain-containing oxidoreductase [Gaiellaceae bacterium]|nr:bi-domain-containing oxidoreductase [Gaiellaceae bacterium]